MPSGDKDKYTGKQKRQAEHIEQGYEKRGTPEKEAQTRAWATVNSMTHGGKKSGSGRGQPEGHTAAQKGGHIGGQVGGAKGGKVSDGGPAKKASTKARAKRQGWPRLPCTSSRLRHGSCQGSDS